MSYNRRGGGGSHGNGGGGGGPDYRKAYYAQQHGYAAAEEKFGSGDSGANQSSSAATGDNSSYSRAGGGGGGHYNNNNYNNGPRGGGRGGGGSRGGRGGGYSVNNAVFQGGPNAATSNVYHTNNNNNNANNNSNNKCFSCGGSGHMSRDCPNKGGNNGGGGGGGGRGGGGGACFKCGQPGHISRDCPSEQLSRGGGGGGNYNNNNNNNNNSNNPSSPSNGGNRNLSSPSGNTGNCFKCGQPGHFSRDCPNADNSSSGGTRGGGGGGRGRGRQDFQEGGQLNIDTRTNYDRIVRQFIDNEELIEMAFPSTLTPTERHAVHELAMHYNLDHASSGPREARVLTLTKKGGMVKGGAGVDKDGNAVAESAKLTSEGIVKTIDGYQGLQDLADDRLGAVGPSVAVLIAPAHASMMAQLEKVVTDGTGALTRSRRFAEDGGFYGARPKASDADREAKAALANFRRSLPSYKVKDRIVESVRNNAVTIVAGDTGCGKTTQIPQILYDAGIFPKDKAIVCTQPRRISALSVAQRVAKERGEACGDSCGYIIRFENATSSATRIVYVTTGILLRRMNSDPTLNGVSCVVLDEVHERDLMTDFALLMLRDLLVSGKAPHLRIVVMSATIQIEKLQQYFTGITLTTCASSPTTTAAPAALPPIVTIPGTLFKVAEYYLEDALRWLKMPNTAATAMNLIEQQRHVKEGEDGLSSPTAAAASASAADPSSASSEPSEYEKMKAAALTQLSKDDEMTVPFDVIVNLIEMFHSQSRDNGEAILVFLPGWQQISRVGDMLRRSRYAKELSVFMLHSSISATQQARVFNPAPRGFRKVVLATNIAETSITIDDVVFVVDSCILKGTAYDAAGNTVSLKSQMIAKANGIQRRGRAGRVRAGVCVHLLPKSVYAELPDYLPPEILRAPLDEVCLQIKALNERDSVVDVLARALDTPSFASIAHAIKMLKEMSAFDHRERLTNLGRALAAMPLHPQLGKMLLVAAVLGVLSPVAIIASALAAKSPFIRPMPFELDAFDRCKANFDRDDASDHLAALRLYNGWLSSNCSPAYARSNFADEVVLRGMRRSVQQLMRLVFQCGFLRHVLPEALRAGKGSEAAMDLSLRYASRHQNNNGLIRMALLWSFYPRVGCSETHKTRTNRVMFCWDNKPCAVHQSSVLFKKKRDYFVGREFFMYFERMRIEVNLNVMDATLVTPLMALLAAHVVTMHPLKDVPKQCFTDEKSTFAPFRKPGSVNNGGVTVLAADDMPVATTTVLQMDKGKKLFCCPSDQAVVIRDLREVMEFYFSLAVKSVDASLFPQEVVRAIGEVIGFPVEEVDISGIKAGTVGAGVSASAGGADDDDDDDGSSARQAKVFSWNRTEDEESDSDEEGSGGGAPEILDEGYIDRITKTIFDAMTEEQRAKIHDAFGDIAVLRRRDKDFQIVPSEGDDDVGANPALLSPLSPSLTPEATAAALLLTSPTSIMAVSPTSEGAGEGIKPSAPAAPPTPDTDTSDSDDDGPVHVEAAPVAQPTGTAGDVSTEDRYKNIVSAANAEFEDVAWN